MLERIRDLARRFQAKHFPRRLGTPASELLLLLAKAKLTGQPMFIVINKDGHAREDQLPMYAQAGMVTILDERELPCSRCVSGMQDDGTPVDIEELPMIALSGPQDVTPPPLCA